MQVPVIDISALYEDDPNGWDQVMEQLYDAHSTVGFSILTGHGVPARMMDDLFTASARFYALPLEKKLAYRYGANLRGYLPLNTSTLIRSTLGSARKPNYSESFIVLNELDESLWRQWSGSAMGGYQVWPTEPKEFEIAVRRYRAAMTRVGEAIVRCFSCMVGLPRDGLDRYYEMPNPILRLLHYPALAARDANQFGSAPHTDYGCLTFIAQDDVGGLQIKAADGSWFDVPIIPHALVLNTGQVMEAWSGGTLKATPHRVINHPEKSRYSVGFFYDCGLNTRVMPVASMTEPMCACKPQPKTYGEHLETLLRANYSFAD
ncbi:isopenicillin N synthase family dioxygenase [Paraburkholderia rhizosphaerae]|uniref:2-oxoglutarate-dependent ethylene/succinate-forming enzyme n=1 Tax=Paraburkholderia rhizosphaerae TaxID=480658 RepID=A0A4R8M235_9BURK|nr:2OG-Fe(II) oxygenase family protein [Paraburkholderia rhizosphaerae]TDY54924.1 isopenicillin N synthase-like dioxygenase [Paraburkholderia rhizosphaerae]